LERARFQAGRGRIRRIPTPRLQAGLALARCSGVGACIDISDGLLVDLDHVLESSGCSAELDRAAVPRPTRFDSRCRQLGLDPIELALTGGEDYELLFTIRPRGQSGAQLGRRLGVRVTEIGQIVAGGPKSANSVGWRHF